MSGLVRVSIEVCSLFRKDLLIYVIHCRDHKEMKQPTETTLETWSGKSSSKKMFVDRDYILILSSIT